jgi:hypothetical protein
VSADIHGPWVVISSDKLPPGLRKRGAKKKHGPGHGPPAKHGY